MISAPRVPGIMAVTTTSPVLAARKTMRPVVCARSSRAENGNADTMYSAKKLRLPKVEAGLGPWVKGLTFSQNCKAAQIAAAKAPRCTPHAMVSSRSRSNRFRPSQHRQAHGNQRMASMKAR